MSNTKGLTRRQVMSAAGVAAGATIIGTVAPVTPAAAAPKARSWTGANTQNGWPVASGADVESYQVEGSDARVTLTHGAAATVLLHVVRRFHYEVGTLAGGDLRGHRTSRTTVAPFGSNYLSGTAVAIRPGLYPVGSAGNFFPRELVVIRDILAECNGVVRWGGDDRSHPKEGHFQIDVPPGDAHLDRLVRTLQDWSTRPGRGAGNPADLQDSTRRSAAKAMQARQRPF
jgi:hypothetical protein